MIFMYLHGIEIHKSIQEENTKIHFQGGTRSSFHFFELICRKQIRQNVFSEKNGKNVVLNLF